MIETFAITLATFMISTSPLNSAMPENYSAPVEPTAIVRLSIDSGLAGKILTPNGTEVLVSFPDERDTSILNVENRLICDYFYNVDDSDIVSIKADASYTYNGIAYAFHMRYGGRACWFEKIDAYLEDKSFVEVYAPQEGDIVCYYAGEDLINAGIIKDVYPRPENEDLGSNMLVESKWHQYGVFEHRGDLCPYISKYNNNFGANAADRLVYYRRHETHNFVVEKGSDGGNTHTEKCRECGATQTVSHKFTYSKKVTAGHSGSCACGKVKYLEPHTWTPYSDPLHTGPYFYVRCVECSFIKKLAPDENVPVIKPFKFNVLSKI